MDSIGGETSLELLTVTTTMCQATVRRKLEKSKATERDAAAAITEIPQLCYPVKVKVMILIARHVD